MSQRCWMLYLGRSLQSEMGISPCKSLQLARTQVVTYMRGLKWSLPHICYKLSGNRCPVKVYIDRNIKRYFAELKPWKHGCFGGAAKWIKLILLAHRTATSTWNSQTDTNHIESVGMQENWTIVGQMSMKVDELMTKINHKFRLKTPCTSSICSREVSGMQVLCNSENVVFPAINI